jgi:type I restriction enzyme, R subunit
VFIELKAHHKKLRVAFDNNLRDYKDTIQHVYDCNAFVLLSNGIRRTPKFFQEFRIP